MCCSLFRANHISNGMAPYPRRPSGTIDSHTHLMNSLVFAITTVCTLQTGSAVTDVSVYNKDKTFKATLHLPKTVQWGSQPTEYRSGQANPVGISLTNASGESRFAFETFWESYAIYYENVGKGPLGGPVVPMQVVNRYPQILDARFMRQLRPGDSLSGSIFPEYGWFFPATPNGTYKVNIVYDDSSLWPPNMADQRVGRIVFPLTLRVTNDSLTLVPRQAMKGEVGRPPKLYIYPCQPVELPNYMKNRKSDNRRG